MLSSFTLESLETLRSVLTWTAAIGGAVAAAAVILIIPVGNQIYALKGARSLSDAEQQTLSELLPRGPFEPPFLLNVVSPLNDLEARSFAHQIADQIGDAEWNVEFAPNTVFGEMQPKGISLFLKSPNADRLEEHVEGLAKALSAIGHFNLETWTDRVRDDFRGGDVLLIVGHK